MSKIVKRGYLGVISNWILAYRRTKYIRLYGSIKSPHILPRHISDHLIFREMMDYQIILHVFNSPLIFQQNKLLPTYPLYIRLYGLNNSTFARVEAKEMEEYNYGQERFKIHDIKKVISIHKTHVAIIWPYSHEH
jgi:hypothetical protein